MADTMHYEGGVKLLGACGVLSLVHSRLRDDGSTLGPPLHFGQV